MSLYRALIALVRRLRTANTLRPALSSAGKRLQLPVFNERSFTGDIAIGGPFGPFRVWIALDDGEHAARDVLKFTVLSEERLPMGFRVASRALYRRPPPLGASAHLTFDESFDRWFSVHGAEREVAVLLDPTLRSRFSGLNGYGTILAEGRSIVLITYELITSEASITRIAERMLQLAQALFDVTFRPEARLLANAMSEPTAAARFRVLDLLLREHAGTPEAAEGEKMAWAAPERGIKYLAAIRGGERAFNFLEEIAEQTTEPSRLRAMALRHLYQHAPPERVLPLLRQTFHTADLELTTTLVELVGRLQDRLSLPALVSIGRRRSTPEDLRTLIAYAAGQIADPVAEAYLLEELNTVSIKVRLAAVQSLGRIGSRRSLGMLQRISARTLTSRDLALAARSAIARIEQRIGPVEGGRLSLAETPALVGSLSFQREEGGLSLNEAPREDDVA